MSPADTCRVNGWSVGTRLNGTEVYLDGEAHTDTIRITAIGQESVLAVNEKTGRESGWTFDYRDWRVVA